MLLRYEFQGIFVEKYEIVKDLFPAVYPSRLNIIRRKELQSTCVESFPSPKARGGMF